jgi:hypothetical protein
MRSSYFPLLIVAGMACSGSDGGALFGPLGAGGAAQAGSGGNGAESSGGSAQGTGGGDGVGGTSPDGTGGAAEVDGGSGGSSEGDARPGLGGSGGTPGAGGSSNGGNTAAGGSDNDGGGTGGALGASGLTLRCGSAVCDPKYEACCLHGDAGVCVTRAGKCLDKGTLLRCDDPSDCALGEVCCATQKGGDMPPDAMCAKECSSTGPGPAQPLCDPQALVPCFGFPDGFVCDDDSNSIIPSYAYCGR